MTINDKEHMRINFEYPYFVDYLSPKGFLPEDRAAHACFYFFMLCEGAKRLVGKSIDNQVVLEGDPWRSTHFVQQRRAIMIMYGLDSMGAIDKYWPAVKHQARLLGLPEPSNEYMSNIEKVI